MLLVGLGLRALIHLLGRSRLGFAIGIPIAVAVTVRMFAAAGVSLTSIGSELRGGDELLFLREARAIAETPFASSEWLDAFTGKMHEFVLAVQVWAFDSSDFVLRLGEVGITVAGIVLLVAAVYELAGARAAILAAWLLALEPSGLFFSSILHKEAPMFVAEGLVAFGGARIWKRGDLGSLAILGAGCFVGVATRPYAGWFLIAASAAIVLHAGLRTTRRNEVNALGLIAVVILVVGATAPIAIEASSDKSLEENLQQSQDANAADADANLALERVDFSTREDVILNLPIRLYDLTFRPYIWQLGSASQRFGAIGGLFALFVLAVLIRTLYRRGGEIFSRAGPLVYTGFFLFVAYSLSTGNAGTGFRYRAHLLAIALCMIATLWQSRTELAASQASARGPEPFRPTGGRSALPATSSLRSEPRPSTRPGWP